MKITNKYNSFKIVDLFKEMKQKQVKSFNKFKQIS